MNVYDNSQTPISKEQVKQIVDQFGSWEGYSEEWRISTYTKLKIEKHESEYGVYYSATAECDWSFSGLHFVSFDHAFEALDELHKLVIDEFYKHGWTYKMSVSLKDV